MTTRASWPRPREKGKTSQAIWIGEFYSEGHGDGRAFALEVEWYQRTPIPVCIVIRGNTSVGSADDLALAEANRLRPTWAFIRPSDIERGERATASLAKDMGVWDRCNPRGPGRTCAV